MATRISLTPAQIALAGSDDYTVSDSIPHGEDTLEEVVESEASTPEEAPDTEEDFYEQFNDETDEENDVENEGWLTDDLKEYGKSYGLTDEELKSFDSEESLRRFGDLTDRRLSQQVTPGQSPEPVAESEDSSDEENEPIEYDRLLEQMEEENYDDISKLMVKRVRELESREQQREAASLQKRAEESEMQQIREFDIALDNYDEALFGSSTSEGKAVRVGPAHERNRTAVYERMLGIEADLKAQAEAAGQEYNVSQKVLVDRAVRSMFGDLESTEADSGKVDRLEKQSRRRRPTGANRGQNSGSAPPARGTDAHGEDDVAAIAQSPKMRAFWEKTQRQNGQV